MSFGGIFTNLNFSIIYESFKKNSRKFKLLSKKAGYFEFRPNLVFASPEIDITLFHVSVWAEVASLRPL